jgi:hypothetical protein
MCTSGSEDMPDCSTAGEEEVGSATKSCSHHVPDFSVKIALVESGDSDILIPLVWPNGAWGES